VQRAAALAAIAFVAAACGGNGDENAQQSQAAPRQTLTISETDFALDPASVSVDSAGTYAFQVVNDGQVAHALEVEGKGIEEETKTLQPGERATLTVALEAGSYELYCPVGDHAERGMKGELMVAGESGGSGY
jgi:uncharacterized cupredoxin-like copper-binding protein